MMTPEQFRAAGLALFGPAWGTALARRLSVSPGFVSNMAAGRDAIPAGMASRLLLLLDARAAEIAAARPALLAEAAVHPAVVTD